MSIVSACSGEFHTQKLSVVIFSLCALLLAGCGGGSVASAPAPTETLSGNWLLSGTLPQFFTYSYVPGFALTIDVQGTSILATGILSQQCGSSSGEIIFSPVLSGTLNADNSFVLSTASQGDFQARVSGVAPKSKDESWSGTYIITETPFCSSSQSASFTASSIADVTGTFSGQGSVYTPNGKTANLAVTVALQQGALVIDSSGATIDSAYGLSGTIEIQGLSCFSKGSVVTPIPSGPGFESVVAGSFIQPRFVMDDNSTLMLAGDITSLNASEINAYIIQVNDGNCAGEYAALPSEFLLQR